MNKKRIAAGVALLGVAAVVACLAFQDRPGDAIGVALGHWPLVILAAALAVSGAAVLVRKNADPPAYIRNSPVGLTSGRRLDRLGAHYGVKRRPRVALYLPFGPLLIMEKDDDFRARVYMAAYTSKSRPVWWCRAPDNETVTDRGNLF